MLSERPRKSKVVEWKVLGWNTKLQISVKSENCLFYVSEDGLLGIGPTSIRPVVARNS